MAKTTPNLGLVLPAHNEFTNSWDIPINGNFSTLDQAVGGAALLLSEAAGSQPDLPTRLNVAMNADGSLQATPEVVTARSSTVYGYQSGAVGFLLNDRLQAGDREVFDARMGQTTLKDILAFGNDDNVANSVVSAPPGFLSFTGPNVKVDGSVTPVVCNINGYRQVVRTLKSTTISGGAGTYYVYLALQAPEIIIDDTAGLGTGAVGIDGVSGSLIAFTDSTQNFITSGVKPGDILEITTTGSANKGQWVVGAVASATQLNMIGLFNSAQAALNYKVSNPLAPALNFTSTVPPLLFQQTANRIYIGQAVFDGTNVTSVSSYALKGRYQQFTQITLLGGAFSLTLTHALGAFPRKAFFYASQANDLSQPLEPLSVADDSGHTMQRSVLVKMDANTIYIKNPTSGLFYTDFSGSSQTTGYLFVVLER